MEWEKQQQAHSGQEDGNGVGSSSNNSGGMFLKVMTDEQMEVLRKQIAIYVTICDQLVDLHKSLTSFQDLAGVRLGNLYCDPLVTSGGHKITGRQRWTPTPLQLQILERIFDQGNGTPSKQKIKDITSELSQHGHISETNVYNWFQNRRARSKRKQHVSSVPNNVESEVEIEVESSSEKKTKSEDIQSQQNSAALRAEDMHFNTPEISSGLNKVEPAFPSDANSKPASGLGPQMSFSLSNIRMDHLVGKMEVHGNYNSIMQAEEYNITG